MQLTKSVLSLLFFFPTISIAATDAECLKHLGGAYFGIECYSGLSKGIAAENTILKSKIYESIPKGNEDKILLNQYEYHQAVSKKYCQLTSDSMNNWKRPERTANPQAYDYDVVYYECVNDILVSENKFLKGLLENLR